MNDYLVRGMSMDGFVKVVAIRSTEMVRRGDVWHRSFEEHREYAYSQAQLTGFLKDAGFTHIEVYADRRFEAPAPGEQRIYMKARKGKRK